LRFTYTAHAAEMLIDRRLERTWVERTVLTPEAIEPDPKHPERIRAFRALPERDGRVLRVVYVQDAESIRIVTLFLDRARRRR
jgi:hypothetical protein